MSASVPGTARDTLHEIALLISAHGLGGQPAPDLVYALQLSAEIAGELPLSVADVASGVLLVEQPRATGAPDAITARRKTCVEIRALIGPTTPGVPARLAAVYRAVERQLFGTTIAREAAIAATAGREASEIEALIDGTFTRGTLTYRRDRGDWLLQLASITAVIDGPRPPTNGDGWTLVDQLLPIVRPLLASMLTGPQFQISIVDPDGVDIVGERPPGGLTLAFLSSLNGELRKSVPKSGPPMSALML